MPRRILVGEVVSDVNDKTIVVKVERRFSHPLLQKTIMKSKRYHAHDDKNLFKSGDIVRIKECVPISKKKSWYVLGSVE